MSNALEAALKLKETSGLFAEGVPLLGLTSRDAAAPATAEAYAALMADGADLRTLGPAEGSDVQVPHTGHAFMDPITTAPAFYLFAAHLSLSRGNDPDQPRPY